MMIMISTTNMINSLIPITLFNRGQASRIFDRLKNERQLIVLKNNQTSAVILSPDEYERLAEIEENYMLLIEAERRLAAHEGESDITEAALMEELGISQKEVNEAEEPIIG